MEFFYTDYGILGSHNQEWLQGALNVLIGLFWRIGLVAKISKSKKIMCHPGSIRSAISEELFS